MVWQEEDLRTRLDEVLTHAREEGPQVIEVEEAGAQFLVSIRAKPRRDFLELLPDCPSFEGVDLTRDKSLPRDVSLK